MKHSDTCSNRQKATIRDVALMVGVTPATVSHAFNGKRAISDKVRQQVFDAARKLDYQPNIIAQAMRNKATGLIGVLINPAGLQKNQMRLAEIVTALQMNHYDTIITLENIHVKWVKKAIGRSHGDAFRFEGYPSDGKTIARIVMNNCIGERSPQTGAVFMGCSDVSVNNFRPIDTWVDGLHFNAYAV